MAKRFGKYLLHECVAQGGITEIWMATDEFENVVAVRKLRGSGLSSSSAPKMFKVGLKVHRKLSPHPNIIRYINHGKADGTPYMVLEYIQGADLKALMSREHDMIIMWPMYSYKWPMASSTCTTEAGCISITNRKTSWSHSTAT